MRGWGYYLLYCVADLFLPLMLVSVFPCKQKKRVFVAGMYLSLLAWDLLKQYFMDHPPAFGYHPMHIALTIGYLLTAFAWAWFSLEGWIYYRLTNIQLWWFMHEALRNIVFSIFDLWTLPGATMEIRYGVYTLVLALVTFGIARLRLNSPLLLPRAIFVLLWVLMLMWNYFGMTRMTDSGWFYAFLYITLCILFAAWCIARILHQMETNQRQTVQNQIQKMELDNARSLYADTRHVRHEFRNQMTVLSGLLQSGHYEELAAYFAEMEHENRYLLHAAQTGNEVVNAILNQEALHAQREQVFFQAEAAVSAELPIAMYDLSAVLFNAIDNAIEAEADVADPEVRVDLKEQQNYLFLTVRNRVDHDVLSANPQLKTTKGNPWEHGNGLPLMREMVRRYQGDLMVKQQDGWFILTLSMQKRTPPEAASKG